ncbi:hypothetical protein Glove_236g50 [Diversispora epigaea]|uniref:Uncharacterized protein n=1 Tax=Diversispora epigaea TaxID=1348612 RepID=A0A397IIP8_9GLOM|nr:hypothetical protein Glove_236g50 [Diversispora epigaea]
MFCLFANKKSNPKELFEALHEIIKNRENNLNNNKNNNNGNDEMVMLNQMICLREIMRAIIQKAIEELVDLWDKFESAELFSQEVARLQELYAKCANGCWKE